MYNVYVPQAGGATRRFVMSPTLSGLFGGWLGVV